MKKLVLLTLLITVGCILATGCVAQTKKDPVNGNVSVTPNTFMPFKNATMEPGSNATINTTNVTNSSVLRGPLQVSISGYPAELDVIIDKKIAGQVTKAKPLELMLEEGNHNVSVCVGDICEYETVKIAFARMTFVDFGDRLRKDVEFPLPTGRILDYYKNGDGVNVVVEFINPTTKDLTMSAEISVGYSYIDYRSGTRKGESSRNSLRDSVTAGTRYQYNVNLYFVNGQSYIFDPPTIREITYK